MPSTAAYAPILPDFTICDIAYGQQISLSDCIGVVVELPQGSGVAQYDMNIHPIGDFELPWSQAHGSCRVSVELAGQNIPSSVQICPDDVRAMADHVVGYCVLGEHGIGGFVTKYMDLLQAYTQTPSTLFAARSPYSPLLPWFLTVTVTNVDFRNPSPGSNDPVIPFFIHAGIVDKENQAPENSDIRNAYQMNARLWDAAGQGVSRGGSTPWYRPVSSPSDMTYECDAGLGNPQEVDCNHIQWDQLGPASVSPPSEIVNVGPGNTSFLNYKSCMVAISSAVATSLGWPAIRSGLETLQAACYQVGSSQLQGGKAFHTGSTANVGRKRDTQVSGLDALPPGTVMTMFQQNEAYVNPQVELSSCTWKAIENGQSTSSCPSK